MPALAPEVSTANPTDTATANPTDTRHPALLVLHDWHGLDDTTAQASARLSQAGFVTYAPDLLARTAPPEGADDAALADWALSLSDAQVVDDVLAALDELASRADVDAARLGIVGWGWSGSYAMMAAAHDGRVRAACDIGGEITYPVLTARRPGSPLNFVANLNGALFAAFAGSDPVFPANEIDRLRARLIEHDKIGEVKNYEGAPPRFWRQPHLPQTAALWLRMTSFLNLHLAPPGSLEEPTSDELQPETGQANEASRLHA